MSKPTAKKGTVAFQQPALASKGWFFIRDFRIQAAILAILTVFFYGNSIKNEYALDDDIIIRQNMYVQKGFSGIGEIMSNDAYKSFYASMGIEQQLSGGRYRPLSIVSFAIEQQLFGKCLGQEYTDARDSIQALNNVNSNDFAAYKRLSDRRTALETQIREEGLKLAPIRHGFQIFWYILALLVVFYFLHHFIFRENTDIAFLTMLLFLFHPIHTEVIANVKSRDEIFSLLFIGLTFIYFFRFDLNRQRKTLIWACVFFFLALLSKEYALVLAVLVPAALIIFHKRKFSDMMGSTVPLVGVLLLYVIIRFSVIGLASAPVDKSTQDPLNDPYLYAKHDQILASKINRLDDYLVLLIKPYRLSADYSYQHFPYSRLFDAPVLISLLVYLGLIALTFRLWRKKHPMAFALLIYLGFFALVSNILFDIGATMGERLIFHSSLGFVMALAWLIIKGAERVGDAAKYLVPGITLLIAVPSWLYSTERNANWKNDFTLFTRDVMTNPNSALCNGNAGAQYMDKALQQIGKDSVAKIRWADSAFIYLSKATTLHKRYVNGFLNLGLCEYHRGHYEEAATAWGHAADNYRNHPLLGSYAAFFVERMKKAADNKDYKTAQYWARLNATANPYRVQSWIDFGGSSYMSGDFATAKYAFNEAFRHKPRQFPTNESLMAWKNDSANAQGGFNAMYTCDSVYNKWKTDSNNVNYSLSLANIYSANAVFYPNARKLLLKTQTLAPADTRVTRMLDSLGVLEKKQVLPPKK